LNGFQAIDIIHAKVKRLPMHSTKEKRGASALRAQRENYQQRNQVFLGERFMVTEINVGEIISYQIFLQAAVIS